MRAALFLEFRVHLIELRQALGGQAGDVGAGEFERRRRRQEAQRRGHPGARRADVAAHLEGPRDRVRVHRTRPAEGDQFQASGVATTFGHVHSGGGDHVLVHHPEDAVRRVGHAQAHRLGDDLADCIFGRFAVEAHAPPQEVVRVQIAQQHVRIGDRRLGAALAVAGGARFGARGLRTHLQQAQLIDPRDAAPTRPDLDQFDGGDPDRQAAAAFEAVHPRDLEGVGHRWSAVPDQAHLGRGTAHVERDQILLAHQFAVVDGRQGARRRPGLDQPYREARRPVERRDAAARQHHVDGVFEAAGFQIALDASEVAFGEGLHVGVAHRRRHPLVLADLRGDLARQRQAQVGKALAQPGGRLGLVVGVGERVQEADGHGLHLAVLERAAKAFELGHLERRQHLAVGVDPLIDLEAQRPRHQRFGQDHEQVVDVVAHLLAHLEDVAKAFGGDQRCDGALAFDQGVRDQRRPMDRTLHRTPARTRGRQQLAPALHHRPRWVIRRRRRLIARDRACFRVDQYEVGERTTDIEPETVTRR